ncbi:alkaline phosphatase family protein [Pseudotenacibaculum haliotis]|uniref:Alkaline phosphatase family protein n=1 Tax=Pseudotenacibaculum haliotis TaxID=1862138 RepID=A0ABW5LSY0_9FLAO
MKNKLNEIEHIVVVMMENRSFDHMLGYLYSDKGNKSPLGHDFDGLTGKEFNLDKQGNKHPVFPITNKTSNPYFMPLADPGEGYSNTNSQLFSTIKEPNPITPAKMDGFVTNFDYTLGWQKKPNSGWKIIGNPTGKDIMGCYSPEMLPVLSTLAKEYAVSDAWFGSAPTETLPNRAFLHMSTSQGILSDKSQSVYTAKSIFHSLQAAGKTWACYGYDSDPLVRNLVADITHAQNSHFGDFAAFQQAAKEGTLANHVFLEPKWGPKGNSQHPNYDVSKGEQYMKQVYDAVRNSPCWDKTLLIITYDEHGGCYDHVSPPENAVNPEPGKIGQNNFNFQRFGPRVPTVLISPLIEAGTVIRAEGATPYDHTSINKTIQKRFGLDPLTERDKAAPCISDVLTLDKPRTDNPLEKITPPTSGDDTTLEDTPSHLQMVMAHNASQLPIQDEHENGEHHVCPDFKTGSDVMKYINDRHKHYFHDYYHHDYDYE